MNDGLLLMIHYITNNINVGIIEIRIPGSTLHEFRQQTKMSQSQFASYFGLSVRNLQEWEQGKKSEPPYLLDLLKRVWDLENKTK